MGVDVDEAGRDAQSGDVDTFPCRRSAEGADCLDPAAGDTDIGVKPSTTTPVDDVAADEDDVESTHAQANAGGRDLPGQAGCVLLLVVPLVVAGLDRLPPVAVLAVPLDRLLEPARVE